MVVKLDLHDDKQKQKAMMAVSGLSGVDSTSMEMKERNLTVIGDIDALTVVSKLRNNWPSTDIVSVGPAKEPEKRKEDGKKDDVKKRKEDGKKDDGKKDDGKEKKMLVLKLDLHDDKEKQKVMMAVSSLFGVDSISMDMKEKKLRMIGDIDPVTVVSKLRKNWPSTVIVSVGQAKEPKKKGGKKDDGKEDGKKDDGKKKKEDGKKDDGKKEDGRKDDGKKKDQKYLEFMKTYGYRAPAYTSYHVHSYEENPNTCVIS